MADLLKPGNWIMYCTPGNPNCHVGEIDKSGGNTITFSRLFIFDISLESCLQDDKNRRFVKYEAEPLHCYQDITYPRSQVLNSSTFPME